MNKGTIRAKGYRNPVKAGSLVQVGCSGSNLGRTRGESGSLVHLGPAPGAGPRFSLPETMREYALEQIAGAGEVAATRARHAAYFLAFAEQAAWLDGLAAEEHNLRAALRRTFDEGDAPGSVRVGPAL